MRISVDASAVSDRGGIGRYLRSLLPRLCQAAGTGTQWVLFARRPDAVAGLALDGDVRVRADRLPVDSGRILSLATSQPRWLRSEQPLLHWGPAHRLPLWIPGRTAAVVTVHDLCWVRQPGTMRRSGRLLDATLMPRALTRADRIIAVSESTANDLRERFPWCADRICVVQEAAEPLPAPAGPAALMELGVRPPYVLFVGTLEPRKNVSALLHAHAALAQELHLQLVLVGSRGWGGVHADVAAAASRSPLVRALGEQADAALSTLYAHALCLALPSLHEGFGLPVLEAFAHGTPVVASARGALPELVSDGGVIVEPPCAGGLADAIRRLATDPDLRQRMGAAATLQASRYSWARAATETLTVFSAAADARRTRISGVGLRR